MDAIIHIGMHKTASSTLQHIYSELDMGNIKYAPWRTNNHSGLMGTMFHTPIEEYHSFKRRQFSQEQLLAEREATKNVLVDFAKQEGKCLFSAEYLSSTRGYDFDEFVDFIKANFDNAHVVAYVRSPVSYMQSSFQQVLKGGALTRQTQDFVKGMKARWPKYRDRFEKFDQAFGKENVTLRPFIPALLKDKDIISDFADVIGYTGDKPANVFVNSSLSLEATALFQFQRTHGSGVHIGYAGSNNHNSYFIDFMNTIKGGKLKFSHDLVKAVFEFYAKDLEWIEDRMQMTLNDMPAPDAGGISTEEDFVSVALNSTHNLIDALSEALELKDSIGPEKLLILSKIQKFIESDDIIPPLYQPGREPRKSDLEAEVKTDDADALKTDLVNRMAFPELNIHDRTVKLLETGKLLSEILAPKRRRFKRK